jgi:hypothetical protein
LSECLMEQCFCALVTQVEWVFSGSIRPVFRKTESRLKAQLKLDRNPAKNEPNAD